MGVEDARATVATKEEVEKEVEVTGKSATAEEARRIAIMTDIKVEVVMTTTRNAGMIEVRSVKVGMKANVTGGKEEKRGKEKKKKKARARDKEQELTKSR